MIVGLTRLGNIPSSLIHKIMRRTHLVCTFLLAAVGSQAESGYDAWLRYAPLSGNSLTQATRDVPLVVATAGKGTLESSAQQEFVRGIKSMLGRTMHTTSGVPKESAVVIGTVRELAGLAPEWKIAANLPAESFSLKTIQSGGVRYIVVSGLDERGVLYGTFALLRKIALGESVNPLDSFDEPYFPVRWLNHWDNLDGTIERGYAGRSIFWDNLHARSDLTRVSDYGRMLASLGINGCSINNVNANPRILAPDFLPDIARVADAFRPWGVRTVISVDFGSPKTVGGLETFDPLDPSVIAWWRSMFDRIYAAVPDLAGVIIKADSEGRVGPSAYNRTHADAANVVARALKPHGGLIFYRGFVYDHNMDWNNPKNDRARAADDNFRPLDGQFDDNVVVQIKNGPIDFQVREPASPLFGNLEKTNQAIEVQITQEYLGQARHTVFLAPMWKEVLDFDMHARSTPTPVNGLASGRVFGRPTGGIIGVANVGLDDNWSGNHMSQANLYGFGRLAWNPNIGSQQIAREWTQLTFGNDPKVVDTIMKLQLSSWRTYENYTGPLGLQTLTDITGNHYGVNVEASERNGWGQWHRADEKGVGMDRSAATGTGYIGQYHPQVTAQYETAANTPDDLLLFMHHVPYTYKLHSGKTVIQYLYDSHYEGAESAAQYARDWKDLKGRVDDRRYSEVLAQLEYQAGQAQVWRDAVTQWFFKESSIPDEKGRVGHYPGRIEAEAMTLSGYTVTDVAPWEAASQGKAVLCKIDQCSATYEYKGAAGQRTIRIQYFDQNNGAAKYRVTVGGKLIDEFTANDRIPTAKLDGSSSTRRTIPNVALRPGDRIQITGIPDKQETAALDYIEIMERP
jgi:alpha-glucuronidase